MEEPTSTQMDQSHDNPWNPDAPVHITPEEYEKQVCTWLSNAAKKDGNNIRWLHREVVEGQGGDYQIDVTGEMSLLGGATLRILVECKRCRRPVERDELLAHAMKVQDTASHKGMVFSTAGFRAAPLNSPKARASQRQFSRVGAQTISPNRWVPINLFPRIPPFHRTEPGL